MQWSFEQGRLAAGPDEPGPFAVRGLGGSVTVGDRVITLDEAGGCDVREQADSETGRGAVVVFSLEEPALVWTWEIAERAEPDGVVLAVTARLRNAGDATLTIGPWNVLQDRKSVV